MAKKITYHKSHTFIDKEGKEHIFVTQLYKIGIYGILDNNPQSQGSFTPQTIKKIEKNLIKLKEKNKIKDFTLGLPITVTNKNGVWEEVI